MWKQDIDESKKEVNGESLKLRALLLYPRLSPSLLRVFFIKPYPRGPLPSPLPQETHQSIQGAPFST